MSAGATLGAVGARIPSANLDLRPFGVDVAPTQDVAATETSARAATLAPDVLPPLPQPPHPPGTMFAAAVAAGALSPRPQSPEELFLRLGGNWEPPGTKTVPRHTDRLA